MGSIRRFEDLIAWQKARELTRRVYAATTPGRFAKDFALSSQIQRASVSVMSNIAEGFERDGTVQFHHFLAISKASCAELRSQLYVALDAGYLDSRVFNELLGLAEEVGRIIGGLRQSLARKTEQSNA